MQDPALLADRGLKCTSVVRRGCPENYVFCAINNQFPVATKRCRHHLEFSPRCTTPDTTAELLERDSCMFAKISQ
jgi:hypothetical protein